MAVQAVIVSRHRNFQAPIRADQERLVAGWEEALLSQRVVAFDIDVQSDNLHAVQLANKSLKLKLKMMDGTVLKSDAIKIRPERNGVLKVRGSVAFEGGSFLGFSLQESFWVRSSRELASGQIDLSDVLPEVRWAHPEDSTDWPHWNLQLHSIQAPFAVLAQLHIRIRVRMCNLRDVGGASALNALYVPPRPLPTDKPNVFEFKDDMSECSKYCDRARVALQHLQDVLDFVQCIAQREGREEADRDTFDDDVSTSCESGAPSLSFSLPSVSTYGCSNGLAT